MQAVDVVLPVLDEKDALPWVLERFPSGYNPIVVDNGSVDGSPDIARRLGATVLEASQKGFGAACFAGLRSATSDLVCFMDCDGSLDPQELDLVCRPVELGEADLVLGRRQAHRGSWPLHARVANSFLSRCVERRTGVALSDLGPMRCCPRADLIGLRLKDRRFGWPLEMILGAHAAGWRLSEVNVAYLPRQGRSKVTGTVRGTLRTARDMRKVWVG